MLALAMPGESLLMVFLPEVLARCVYIGLGVGREGETNAGVP